MEEEEEEGFSNLPTLFFKIKKEFRLGLSSLPVLLLLLLLLFSISAFGYFFFFF